MPVRHKWVRALAAVDDVSLEPACSPEIVAAATAELGADPVAWAVHISAQIIAAPGGGTVGQTPDPTLNDERANCEACVLALLRGLYAGQGRSALVVPAEVWESNQRGLRRGLPFDTLLKNAWYAHGFLQQKLLNFLIDDAAAMTTPEESLQLAAELNLTMTAFFDALWKKSTEEWDYHQRDWEQHAALARREAVLKIIDKTTDVDEAEGVLGVRLTAHHVAIVVGIDATRASSSVLFGRLRRVLADATAKPAAQITLVEVDDGVLGAWLSFLTPPPDATLIAVRQNLTALPAKWCAVGPVTFGTKGFRRSHLVAERLARYARLHPREGNMVLGMDSVRAASLLVDDEDFAGWFVRDTLGDLVGSRRKDDDLRETFLEYLASGRSPRAVSEKLHIAPNTVAYRVKQAQQLLRERADRNPLEVMLALCLARDMPELLVEPSA